jgi:hypothetical protein
MFGPTSRYFPLETATLTLSDGRTVAYVRRRFLPAPESLAVLAEHSVIQGDRLDNVTARYLGDPEQFWRVADANCAMQPEELTAEVGRRLRVPVPQVENKR